MRRQDESVHRFFTEFIMLPIRSGLAAVLSFACLAVPASAQVTVRQNWIAPGGVPRTCIFTTDAAGVVMNTDGSLQMNGSYGQDCPTGGVTPPSDPSISNGIDASEIPSNAVAGASYNVSWAADADNCSYSTSSLTAPIATWPTTGNVCSDAASCAANHNVAIVMPSTPGPYKFELTCRKTGSSVVATSTRTAMVPGGGSCPGPAGMTRATASSVRTNISTDTWRTVDATQFEPIFGYNSSGGASRPFPGSAGLNQRVTIPRNQFISAQFTVPSNLALNTRGIMKYEETPPNSGTMSITISKTCGYLAAAPDTTMNAKCSVEIKRRGDGLPWGYAPGDGATRCQLEPGQTYYLNIMYAEFASPTTTGACSTGDCDRGMLNQTEIGATWPSAIDDGVTE